MPKKILDEVTREQVKAILMQHLEQKGAMDLAGVSVYLKETIGFDYQEYRGKLRPFLESEFADVFEVVPDVIIDGKRCACGLYLRHSPLSPSDENASCSLSLTQEPLNSQKILSEIRKIAGALGEDTHMVLNDFQRTLLEAPTLNDFLKKIDDETLLSQGLATASCHMSVSEYKAYLIDAFQIKDNSNQNLKHLVERFWLAQNHLAFYLNALWMKRLSNKQRSFDLYIDTAFKLKDLHRLPDFLKLWKNQCGDAPFILPLSSKRKIIGKCLDLLEIDTLCSAISYFDCETLKEAKDLPAYLRLEKKMDSDTLMGYFQSEMERQASANLTHYFWYVEKSQLSDMMITVLGYIAFTYDKEVLDELMVNDHYPDFTIEQKRSLFKQHFARLCEYTKSHPQTYVLVNEVHDLFLPEESEQWQDLKTRMIKEYGHDPQREQYFKLDPITLKGLETGIIDESLTNVQNYAMAYLRDLKDTPDKLGWKGIWEASKALAAFLGDPMPLIMNDFQRSLIETGQSRDLIPYKEDDAFLFQGLQSSFAPMGMEDFRNCFRGLCLNGTFNNNWPAMTGRFWYAKNDLAFYINMLWLIVSKQEKCVVFYLTEAKKNNYLKRLPDVLKIWQKILAKPLIPLANKRMMVGNCLDLDDIDTLIQIIAQFDEVTMKEAKELPPYLKGEKAIDSERLYSYFHSDIDAQASEKLVNYFWYHDICPLSETIIQVLTSICWDYDDSYLEVILYNKTYSDFTFEHKRKILVDAFDDICVYTRSHRKTYVLVNYIYAHFMDKNDQWQALKAWMIEEVKSQLTADPKTTMLLNLFKYDETTRHQLESDYCEVYIQPLLQEGMIDLEQYADISFIHTYLTRQFPQSHTQAIEALIGERRFLEAIKYVQTNDVMNVAEKKAKLRQILIANNQTYGFSEKGNVIFVHGIPAKLAEVILLEGLSASDSDVIETLFALYLFLGNHLKVAYMYAPYRAMHQTLHPKPYSEINGILRSHGIDANQQGFNHVLVVKQALRALSSEDFDAFVEWARKIPVPEHSSQYKLPVASFNQEIRVLLSSGEKDRFWNQMLKKALRTDRQERMDMLHYAIITSYIGRYGMASYEKVILELSRDRRLSRSYESLYASIWKGLLDGYYSCNIFSLNLPLIGEAPLTYWNLFYDIAVCKNHLFTLNGLWGLQWVQPDYPLQAFYEALLDRYVKTREAIFLMIAVKLLEQSEAWIQPDFDKYLSYCNSNQSKNFLFQGLVRLIQKNRYLQEIQQFLKSDIWIRNETENRLSHALEQICQKDIDIPDPGWQEQFVQDFLSVFADYPNVELINVLRDRNDPLDYRYQLIRHVVQISMVEPRAMENAGLIVVPHYGTSRPEEIQAYVEMMDVCYRRQLQNDRTPYLVWTQNRYHRILAASLLLGHEDDEGIVALMQNHQHFSDVYPNYKHFKECLLHLLASPQMTERHQKIILLSIISNQWQDFISHMDAYSDVALADLYEMMTYTNYRELNMQLLDKYLITFNGVYTDEEVRRMSAFSAKLGYVLKELQRLHNHEMTDIIIAICRLQKQNQPLESYQKLDQALKTHHDLLMDHWDLVMSALWETSYPSTIVDFFGADVRNTRHRCTLEKIQAWEPVFRSISQMSLYDYLLAIWYALNRQRNEAREAYSKIVAKSELPALLNQERTDLEAYLEGRSERFVLISNSRTVATLSTEKEAGDLDFISQAVDNRTISLEEAVYQYQNLGSLGSYKKLFSYIHDPDQLYEIYRQLESKRAKVTRKTYNELVIAFGSLLITEDEETFDHDAKFAILLSIMDVYELLSDVNKEKETIREQLKRAERFVLGTSGLSLSIWLSSFDRIKAIMAHPVIGNPNRIIDDLSRPVLQCMEAMRQCDTKMKQLNWLGPWRKNLNAAVNCSDYERAFISAVDESLKQLENGYRLILNVCNEAMRVEDDRIFYEIRNNGNKALALKSARLEVKAGLNGETPIVYDNAAFSSIVELRPGDVCGQVYALHPSLLSRIKNHDQVEVILNLIVDDEIICNNEKRRLTYETERTDLLTSDLVSLGTSYETAVPAFTRMIKGYGRHQEKALIQELLAQQLVVIYGPSRAGKSSLMNYINNDYIDTYCKEHPERAILSIMIAGEGHPEDYTKSMLDPQQGIHEDMLEYIFLAPFRLSAYDSRYQFFGRTFPSEVLAGIQNILNHAGSILSQYTAISRLLKRYDCEIWLLYDEFQQTLSRLSGKESELANLCSSVKYNLENIRLVLCGSDDLLRVFECNDDPKWNDFTIRTAGNSVCVGQLEKEDFIAMLEDEHVWHHHRPFSTPALELLHQYTGGNAICGKIFGNEILDRLRKGEYAKRQKIYSSDMTEIAYSLLSSKEGKVYSQLIAHNNKNLDEEMKYLLLIAHELASDPDRSDISYHRIRDFFANRSAREIDLALKILVARGILEVKNDRYRFTTMFYFDFFKSQTTEARMKELDNQEHQIESATPNYVEEINEIIASNQEKFDLGDAIKIIGKFPEDIRKGIGTQYGKGVNVTQNYHGDVVQGNKLVINAKTINNAFHTLLAGQADSREFAEALRHLPTVSAYLSNEDQTKLLALKQERAACDTNEDIIDVEERIEELTEPARQQLISDTVGAAVATEDFTEVTEARWIALLGLHSSEELDRIRQLPTEIVTPLSFAVMLHNVFERISENMQESVDELDYCPVAMMYCKVVEASLKKWHTPLYIERLGRDTLNSKGKRFSELLAEDGLTILPCKDLTIGSFSHSIVSGRKDNDINQPQAFYVKPIRSKIRRLSQVEDDGASINQKWSKHAQDLAVVQAIRNRSAHEATPITQANFTWLMDVLFREGEFLRIIELSQ